MKSYDVRVKSKILLLVLVIDDGSIDTALMGLDVICYLIYKFTRERLSDSHMGLLSVESRRSVLSLLACWMLG